MKKGSKKEKEEEILDAGGDEDDGSFSDTPICVRSGLKGRGGWSRFPPLLPLHSSSPTARTAASAPTEADTSATRTAGSASAGRLVAADASIVKTESGRHAFLYKGASPGVGRRPSLLLGLQTLIE